MFTLDYNDKTITVYETADMEVLRELITRHSIEYMKSYRKGKNKTGEYYNYPNSFDIETSTIVSGDLDYEGDTPMGIPYLFQFNVFGFVYMCRTYEEAMDFFNMLANELDAENRTLYFAVHNLNYEFQFFKNLWHIESVFALDAHKPITVRLTNGIVFRDSYKLTNMSLELFSKNWCTVWKKEKEIMDYDVLRTPSTPLDDNTLLYSALDVLCLSEAVENYLNAHKTDIHKTSVTATGFTRTKVRKACRPSKIKTKEEREFSQVLSRTKIDPDVYKLLRENSKGGNTHANERYNNVLLKDLVHFDICSSYPTQMICYPEYPVAEWHDNGNADTGFELENLISLEHNGYCTLSEFIFENLELKEGVQCPTISQHKMIIVPNRDDKIEVYNGRYIRGASTCRLTLFGIEFLEIIDKDYYYDDVIIQKSYRAFKDYLPDIFRKQILYFFKDKTELKGVEGKESEYAIGKTNLNSIFGSCYTDPIRKQYVFQNNIIEPELESKPVEEALKDNNEKKTYFAPYSWGAMTAVLGQVFLHKMIEAVGEDFVYCDTDSVFALNPDKSRASIKALEAELNEYHKECGLEITAYDIKGRPHTLGTIDEEEPLKEFKTLGSKKYAMETYDGDLTITIAGVPKKNGGKCISCVDDMVEGLIFRGEDTKKMTSTYNHITEPLYITDTNGYKIKVYSNIGLTYCDYLLSKGDRIEHCLYTHGNKLNSKFNYILRGD